MPAPATDSVEVLQGESGGIDLFVAGPAIGSLAMLLQLFANRFRAADIGFESGNIRGRWRRGRAQDVLEQPDSADDRGRVHAIGREGQHTRLS